MPKRETGTEAEEFVQDSHAKAKRRKSQSASASIEDAPMDDSKDCRRYNVKNDNRLRRKPICI